MVSPVVVVSPSVAPLVLASSVVPVVVVSSGSPVVVVVSSGAVVDDEVGSWPSGSSVAQRLTTKRAIVLMFTSQVTSRT